MQGASNAASSRSNNDASRRVLENQEAYKRALVDLLKEVMHPPEFTERPRTGRYAWCILVNKLLCKLKSVTSNLAPADVPRSFEDIDAFIHDAWRFGFADEVPNFYTKWPRDLDRLVEDGFKKGIPLGRAMSTDDDGLGRIGSAPQAQASRQSAKNRRESAAGSAAGRHVHVAAADGSAAVSSPSSSSFSSPTATATTASTSTSTTAQPVTPCTPSPDLRVQSSSASDTSLLPLPLTPLLSSLPLSPSRRFSMADFEQLLSQKDYGTFRPAEASRTPSVSSRSTVRNTNKVSPPSNVPSASVDLPSESLPRNSTPGPSSMLEPEPAPEPNPEAHPTPDPQASRSASLRRSSSSRPWIPQSYRDGSMPADLAELFSELDEVCQAADCLIVEAEDMDARDEGETRLRGWTSRARRCEVNGRKALARISSTGLSKTDEEVLYVTSTLRLLKSAHVELIEYANSMLNPSGTTSTSAVNQRQDASIRNYSEPDDSPVVSQSPHTPVPVEAAGTPQVGREVETERPRPCPSRLSTQRRPTPYVMVPSVPWKWRPASPQPQPQPQRQPEPQSQPVPPSHPQPSSQQHESEPKPNRSTLLTSSITIRTRRGLSPSQAHRTIKLQRMADREPGDVEHVPACPPCAERGLSCFGEKGACRRCRRVRKGGCTYSRPKGGWGAAGSATASTAAGSATGQMSAKGRGKEKQKEVVRPLVERRRVNEGTKRKVSPIQRGKRMRSGRSSDALRKLRDARARMEMGVAVGVGVGRRRRNAGNINPDSESESDDDSALKDQDPDEDEDVTDSETDHPPLKRRRSASARPTHEPESNPNLVGFMQSILPMRATSEPPDRALQRMESLSQRLGLARTARSSTLEMNVDGDERLFVPPESGNVGLDAWTAAAYNEPEVDQFRGIDYDSRFQAEAEGAGDLPMEAEPEPPHRHEAGYTEGNPSTPIFSVNSSTSLTRLPVPSEPLSFTHPTASQLEHSIPIPGPSSESSVAQLTIATPSQAPLPSSAVATIPTPTSLTSSSPSDMSISLPLPGPLSSSSSRAIEYNPSSSPNTLLIASLAAKLDTLIASQNALTAEVHGAQAKLALQADIIEEVRETLRVLRASGGGGLDAAGVDARRLLEN